MPKRLRDTIQYPFYVALFDGERRKEEESTEELTKESTEELLIELFKNLSLDDEDYEYNSDEED